MRNLFGVDLSMKCLAPQIDSISILPNKEHHTRISEHNRPKSVYLVILNLLGMFTGFFRLIVQLYYRYMSGPNDQSIRLKKKGRSADQ
jgi:hypothetical protein